MTTCWTWQWQAEPDWLSGGPPAPRHQVSPGAQSVKIRKNSKKIQETLKLKIETHLAGGQEGGQLVVQLCHQLTV